MNDIIKITLTEFEMELAALVGTRRQIQNIFGGRKDAYGADYEDGWTSHIEGAAGEIAVAKWGDKFWNGNIGDLKADDVGSWQVRTTTWQNGCLILHPDKDADDKVFFLATGLAPTFFLRGWLRARDGKKEEYWSDPQRRNRWAFFVPQSKLRPMKRRDE